MDYKAPTPPPDLHRDLTPGEYVVPTGAPAGEPDADAAALAGIKADDKLAQAAGIRPDVLQEVENEEWKKRLLTESEMLAEMNRRFAGATITKITKDGSTWRVETDRDEHIAALGLEIGIHG